jgi:A/G-specific adenine glycosylase
MLVDSGSDPAVLLLTWYDRHGRTLPWRSKAPERTEPYRVWLSEIMLQQTTVAAVKPYFRTFTTRWPTVGALADAPEADVMAAWAGLGYYARARNLVACAKAVAAGGGDFPDTEEGLRALPGIGRYTAAAVAAIAFDRRAVVVDANVERVVSRLFAIEESLPASRPKIDTLADRITPDQRSGDFAQAMMDLGATICTARNPACVICPLADPCEARLTGEPETYPRKLPKAARPVRRGTIFWLQADDHVLLVQRPPKGMLGGDARAAERPMDRYRSGHGRSTGRRRMAGSGSGPPRLHPFRARLSRRRCPPAPPHQRGRVVADRDARPGRPPYPVRPCRRTGFA